FPLVPYKLHLMVRSASTFSVCLDPKCQSSERQLPGGGTIIAEARDHCPACGGKMLTLARCQNCGEWMIAGVLNRNTNTLHPRHRWFQATPPAGSVYKFARP